MPAPAKLIDQYGQPLPPRAAPAPARPRAALSGDYKWAFPYDAGSWYAQETEGWFPYTYSPDHEINVYRDRMVGRIRDLVRNDGWAAGAVDKVLDSTIGGSYRLVAQPDYRALAYRTGNKGFDAVWAAEYRHAVEAEWRGWAEDPSFFCDATRQMTIPQLFYLAFRHKMVDGEPLAALEYHPDRVGYGGARYATCVHIIDPDRLSNPMEMIDTLHRRGGVEIDDHGVPTGYWLRRAHQLDWYAAAESMQWDFFPRETPWGRPLMLHDLDRDRVEQHRGLSIFTPILNRFKMLNRFDSAEVQAAVLSAVMAMAIESPYDPEGLKEMLDSGQTDGLTNYSAQRAQYHGGKPISLEGVKIIPTFPGESVKPIPPAHPSAQYDPFSHAMLRHVAARLGTTAEDISGDLSKVNYSSIRAGMMTAWRTTKRRRDHFNGGFANRVYAGWLEEAHDIADLPMPSSGEIPDFPEARAAFARCRWIAAPRGWVDPVKEAQGAALRLDSFTSTQEMECAEQGLDWEEVLAQVAAERDRMKELGLPMPAWIAGIPASTAEEKPVPQ